MNTFGSTANTQSSAGTLFGAAAATPATGGLFGSSNTSNSAGTLFGSNTANSSAAGTLFGGSASTAPATSTAGFGGFGSTPAASTTSAFGTSAAPSLFGATATSTAAPSTGFGGFGATATSSAAPSTTGFGGFGATATSSAAPSTTGFGGFGAPATSTAAPASGFGGFGNLTSQPAATSSAFGGFGSTAATSQPATSAAGGFGGFGATAPATNTFGSNTTGGFGGFGAKPQQTGFGAPQQQQQQMGAPPPVQEKVWQELALIRAHFDPSSPLCHFRHYFYNMVPANEVHLYVRPQNQDEQLWNEAQRKNPDPTALVPVLAVGFDDILKRMEIQSKQLELHQEKLRETAERLAQVQRRHELGTLVKLDEHKRRHTEFSQRLLRLLRYSQVLRYKNFPLSTDEEKSMRQLDELSKHPNRPELMNQKLMAIRNQLEAIKARQMGHANGGGGSEVWRTVNEEDLNVIAKVLEDEQKGIKHVESILRSDTKELDLIESALNERRKSYMTRH